MEKYWLLIGFIVLMSFQSYGQTFHGNKYPDTLRLYEDTKSDYRNKHRPFIDVDYFFKGKTVESKDTCISDDYDPVKYYWLYVKIDNIKIATCKVTESLYTKYNVGDVIGEDNSKKEEVI